MSRRRLEQIEDGSQFGTLGGNIWGNFHDMAHLASRVKVTTL